MKKVLILFDSTKTLIGGPEYYTKHGPTATCVRALETLGIPVEIGWTASKDVSEAGDYSLVIIPEFYNSTASLQPWAGGAIAAPVFVAYAKQVSNISGFVSGATARGDTAAIESLSTPWGWFGFEKSSINIYTIDATDTAVTKLAVAADGRSPFWKRRGSGGYDVYFWASSGYGCTFALCHVLAQVYTADEVLYPRFPNIDHPETADVDMLRDFIDWLRARNAVCAAGIKVDPGTWPLVSAAMKTLLRENQDVLIPQVHSHSLIEFFGDDVRFPTVAAKIAEYHRQQAILAADGIIVADNASLGFQILPANTVTFLGVEAMANLGITAFRASGAGHPWGATTIPGYYNSPVVLHKVDGKVVRVVGRSGWFGANPSATTLAVEWALQSATDLDSYRMMMHSRTVNVLRYNAPMNTIHGINLTGENPGQMFFDVLDVAVQAASPIVRWSTREDLANMADLYRRRSPWR